MSGLHASPEHPHLQSPIPLSLHPHFICSLCLRPTLVWHARIDGRPSTCSTQPRFPVVDRVSYSPLRRVRRRMIPTISIGSTWPCTFPARAHGGAWEVRGYKCMHKRARCSCDSSNQCRELPSIILFRYTCGRTSTKTAQGKAYRECT